MNAIEALHDAIEEREAVMWNTIKALPTTTFRNTSDALGTIENLGRMASDIRKLRVAYDLMMYPPNQKIDIP